MDSSLDEVATDTATDTDRLHFRGLNGHKKSVYRHGRELAILTSAVERIKVRQLRRALGLYLGVWSGEPWTIRRVSDRFEVTHEEMRQILTRAMRLLVLDPALGRIAESIFMHDQSNLMGFLDIDDLEKLANEGSVVDRDEPCLHPRGAHVRSRAVQP